MTLLNLEAQECSSLWLSCPKAEEGQMVLYSRTYTDLPSLSQSTVVIATNGYFRLYVNGNLVSQPSYPLVRAPYRGDEQSTAYIATQFDVSRYLRNDSNTISVLCCPVIPASTTDFSLRFLGLDSKGTLFSFDADNSWLCRPLYSKRLDSHAEFLDGVKNANLSTLINSKEIMCWTPVDVRENSFLLDPKTPLSSSYEYINKVIKPYYSTIDEDKKGVTYDFGNGFYGLLRITIRETKPNQRLFIAGSEYVCKGKTDEQFILRFSASWFRKVHISGDSLFNKKNVVGVEGLQIVPKIDKNFSFFP